MGATLVMGATGAIGAQVVRELAERDAHLRAFVRDPQRARAVLGDDVELAVGDLADATTIRAALDGVDHVFLNCGNVPGQVGLETNAIHELAAAGVDKVVKLSASEAAIDAGLRFPSWQGEIEQVLRDAQLPAVVLRPSSLMTNLLMSAQMIRATGQLVAPAGGAKIAMIDPRDVGAAAAVVLTEDGHLDRSYALTGPEAITYDQVAAALSEATGRTIEYVDIPDEAARQGLLAEGLPDFLAEFIVSLFAALRDGMAGQVNDTVRALTGREPRGIADFACDHAAAFGG